MSEYFILSQSFQKALKRCKKGVQVSVEIFCVNILHNNILSVLQNKRKLLKTRIFNTFGDINFLFLDLQTLCIAYISKCTIVINMFTL